MKILFFSRGRGRGHAVPDVAIARDLYKRNPAIDLQFVSYGTGARVIEQNNFQVIDLHLPEENPFLETLVRSTHVINDHQPQIIISHEEFAVLPAARLFSIPSLFLIDWFPSQGSMWMDSLAYADAILFMDLPGYFDEPKELNNKLEYVGPVIRDLGTANISRHNARDLLDLPVEQSTILVLPGGASASSEAQSPLFDLVTSAVRLLNKCVSVIWVVSAPEQNILKTLSGAENVRFIEPHLEITKTMMAADLVITKGTRKTSFELNALGIQSISVSHGLNPIDDYRVAHIKTNTALKARGLTASSLSDHIRRALDHPLDSTLAKIDMSSGRAAIVEKLVAFTQLISERDQKW